MNKGIVKILEQSLKRSTKEINIDWFGTMLISGMLDWNDFGYPETKEYAVRWLEYHLQHEPGLTDEEYRRENDHGTDRIFRDYLLPLSTYAGYFGLGFACSKLYQLTKDKRAKQVCIDVGDCILHRCSKNNLGLLMHDDRDKGFTIPDVAYFVIPPMLYAGELDENQGPALKRQAVFQLSQFTNVFFDRDRQLAKTIYRDGKLGETYWTRASGWLLWAMVDSLEFIDENNQAFRQIRSDLETLVNGLIQHQEASGGFHTLIDEQDTPLETTGTAMFAYAIHKAVRIGWIDSKYMQVASTAWDYVNSKIDEDGNITGCYTHWAVPAEAREMEFDQPAGWVLGMVLKTAAEFQNNPVELEMKS